MNPPLLSWIIAHLMCISQATDVLAWGVEPKTVVKVALAQRDMTLGELARRLGIPAQSLSRTLKTSVVNTQSHWPGILEALDLEVEVKPKPR